MVSNESKRLRLFDEPAFPERIGGGQINRAVPIRLPPGCLVLIGVSGSEKSLSDQDVYRNPCPLPGAEIAESLFCLQTRAAQISIAIRMPCGCPQTPGRDCSKPAQPSVVARS
jgi:hypothetical protein